MTSCTILRLWLVPWPSMTSYKISAQILHRTRDQPCLNTALSPITRKSDFFPWYSCSKNVVILVKNITNSGWSVDQYCLLLASAVNIGLGLRPRPILLLRPIKDNIGLLTIHYLYIMPLLSFFNNQRPGFCPDKTHITPIINSLYHCRPFLDQSEARMLPW